MEKKNKTGVIVARFQTSELHTGQKALIQYVLQYCDHVIFILGVSPARLTDKNPLPFEARKFMVNEYCKSIFYPFNTDQKKIQIFPLDDFKSDEKWSHAIDQLVFSHTKESGSIKMFTGRDGFKKYYSGIYVVEELEFGIDHKNASEIRKEVASQIKDSRDWREGVIFSASHKYPTSYQAVDIAIVDFDHQAILVGKKTNEGKYRFIGGFVEPDDESLEFAAKRKVMEECSNIEAENYKYIGSFRIDDWRYAKETDKIMSAFFCCNYILGKSQPQDDIAELKWLTFTTLEEDVFEYEHIPLQQALIKYLKKKIISC